MNLTSYWERIAKMYQLFISYNPTDDLAMKTEVFRALSVLRKDLGVNKKIAAWKRTKSSSTVTVFFWFGT
jgi:hypothetical protein